MDSQYANKAMVDIIVGGTFQDYARVSRAHVVAVFDNQQEVSAIPDQPNLKKVPLGGNDVELTSRGHIVPTVDDIMALLSQPRGVLPRLLPGLRRSPVEVQRCLAATGASQPQSCLLPQGLGGRDPLPGCAPQPAAGHGRADGG
jgi:hypothetical protein